MDGWALYQRLQTAIAGGDERLVAAARNTLLVAVREQCDRRVEPAQLKSDLELVFDFMSREDLPALSGYLSAMEHRYEATPANVDAIRYVRAARRRIWEVEYMWDEIVAEERSIVRNLAERKRLSRLIREKPGRFIGVRLGIVEAHGETEEDVRKGIRAVQDTRDEPHRMILVVDVENPLPEAPAAHRRRRRS